MGAIIVDTQSHAKFLTREAVFTPGGFELDYILSRTSSTSLDFYATNYGTVSNTTADSGGLPAVKPTLGAVAATNTTIDTYGSCYVTSWIMGGGMNSTQYTKLSQIIRAYNVATGRS